MCLGREDAERSSFTPRTDGDTLDSKISLICYSLINLSSMLFECVVPHARSSRKDASKLICAREGLKLSCHRGSKTRDIVGKPYI